MAFRLSDRVLDGMAFVSLMPGLLLTMIVAERIARALLMPSGASGVPPDVNSGQDSWVAFTSLAIFFTGLALVTNRVAARCGNTNAQKGSKWAAILNVGGFIAFVIFHFTLRVGHT
jgi:hypothetical protein